MKFSIITPTNDPKFLNELYESLKAQTFTDWEWVILLNSNASYFNQDSRVKIFNDASNNSKVGYLKNKAFSRANGEILVEVDHDDMLTPDCLEELAKAFEDPEIGFVYSNNAKLSDNFVPYNPVFGWEHSKYQGMTVMHSFEPSAASFSFIWYAPDHVRAWRASTYFAIGGHNVELEVCDDHELMIRTYLNTKVKLINKCLYIYRITGENTWLKKNSLIQETTRQLFFQYAQKLAERDADLKGLSKIDIGGGIFPRDGYEILDISNGHDLNKSWPIESNSVGVINASHIIEHLHDKQHTMNEIHRVLSDGGWAFIDVPSTDGRGAFMDPTHVSYWNQNSFWYYTRKDQAQYIKNNTIRFQEFYLETIFPGPWWKENNILVTRAWLRAVKSESKRPHSMLI